jgi:hypothetical protein
MSEENKQTTRRVLDELFERGTWKRPTSSFIPSS